MVYIATLQQRCFHLAALHNSVCPECCVECCMPICILEYRYRKRLSAWQFKGYLGDASSGHAVYILVLARLRLAHPPCLCRHGSS